VRVLHQPRTRVFGESGFKDVGPMTTVGVGVVDLEGVWAASRWTGIVHLRVCEGQEQGRKVITGKDKTMSLPIKTRGRGASSSQTQPHKSAPGSKAASRYASLPGKPTGAEGQQSNAQSVVGRVELSVSLLTLAPDHAPPAADPTCLSDGAQEQSLKCKGELSMEENDTCSSARAPCGTVPAHDEQEQQEQQAQEVERKTGSHTDGRHDAWLLELQDVVGITWANSLRVTCRMVWAHESERQPQLKTCLHLRPTNNPLYRGKGARPWAPGSIQFSVVEPQQRKAAPLGGKPTARSLFGAGCGREQKCLVVLELWQLDLSGKSKQLIGLVQLEPKQQGAAASAVALDERLVCGCHVIMEGSFPVRSPFSGKDVGAVALTLFSGAASNVNSMMQRYDTALQIQLAAKDKLLKLRARQCERGAATAEGEEPCDGQSRDDDMAGHALPAVDLDAFADGSSGFDGRHTESVKARGEGCHAAAASDTASRAARQAEGRTWVGAGWWEASPPLTVHYRHGAEGDGRQTSEKMTHTLTLTIIGIARLPPISTELDALTAGRISGDAGVRDSSDMMVYRPCGIYVRSKVPGDADEALTPVVPVCSHVALHSQSSRSFVLPTQHTLLDSVPALVDTPSWDFQVMHRPKGASSAVSDRQIGEAKLRRDDIVELLCADCLPGSPTVSAFSLPVTITEGDLDGDGAHECKMRVRLTYERTPFFGADFCAKSLIAGMPSGLEGEFAVSNALHLGGFRASGLRVAADRLANEYTRCRLLPFDGPNTCLLLHFSPTPPWQGGPGEGGGGGAEVQPRFLASETIVHSFCPVFKLSRKIDVMLTEEVMEYLNSAVLVVEAWHRVPRDTLEEYQPLHALNGDPRVTEGVIHARDLLMASASVPLQGLLVRPDGIQGWQILHTPDGVAAGDNAHSSPLHHHAMPISETSFLSITMQWQSLIQACLSHHCIVTGLTVLRQVRWSSRASSMCLRLCIRQKFGARTR
jgi:hypothetical protein